MLVNKDKFKQSRYTLKSTIENLFDDAQDILLPLVKSKRRFIEKVVDSRNYYTHYSQGLLQRAAQG